MLLNDYLRRQFGCKVYKLALNGGFTCPNRDGTLDTRGCIFCSAGGSGEFAQNPNLSIKEQIELAKQKVAGKIKDGKYIAYFQAYTGTYPPCSTPVDTSTKCIPSNVTFKKCNQTCDNHNTSTFTAGSNGVTDTAVDGLPKIHQNISCNIPYLRQKYLEAINHPDVVALSIATRPDCLPEEVLDLLFEVNKIKPVWIELGLQTIHETTAQYIRRGYNLSVYDDAVRKLRKRGIEVITHVILGLPGETKEDMLATVRYVCDSGATGIKLQLLHVLKGTDLEKVYLEKISDSENLIVGKNLTVGKNLAVGSDVFKKKDLYANIQNFNILSEDEYIDLLKVCVAIIPEDIVIHRLTGDGDKKLLVAPLWSANKKHVWNRIQHEVF
ncbi:MAG: radical SAM protein [Lachnospiraceae bacterium]|nr:radical SAM protein [Lachnospiraceae bacterium]